MNVGIACLYIYTSTEAFPFMAIVMFIVPAVSLHNAVKWNFKTYLSPFSDLYNSIKINWTNKTVELASCIFIGMKLHSQLLSIGGDNLIWKSPLAGLIMSNCYVRFSLRKVVAVVDYSAVLSHKWMDAKFCIYIKFPSRFTVLWQIIHKVKCSRFANRL